MVINKGRLLYAIYRTLTSALSPFIFMHLQWRRLGGLEHPRRWPERLGRPSAHRPSGRVIWFHAVSLGEGMASIPIIKICLQELPNSAVLLTVTTLTAFEMFKDKLPGGVIFQFAPLDTSTSVDAFMDYWKPYAIFLMENELWPNLILSASAKGIVVVLLNARISAKSFNCWSKPVALPLISLMLSKLSLIIPLSTVEAIRFQLLQAPPSIIHFAGDLKYAVGDIEVSVLEQREVDHLWSQVGDRPVWMVSSLHKGEEKIMIWVHKALMCMFSEVFTIIVPRHPYRAQKIAMALWRENISAVLRSKTEPIKRSTSFYIIDTIGELRSLYRLTPIAVIGGSFLPGLAGHNMSEAAAAGCAVLTGPHVGHFSHMVQQMRNFSPLSIHQVAGKMELVDILKYMFHNPAYLEACKAAAKQAHSSLSRGIVRDVWKFVGTYALQKP